MSQASFFRSFAVAVLSLVATGCTSVSYYTQSLEGHAKIMTARQDVAKLVKDPSTPAALRAPLVEATAIRKFAVDELGLPDNKSYRSYVDVGQEAVTWAVFAAPEFSLAPRTWCFPVYGCVPYRGYFSKEKAIDFAHDLQQEGLDIHVSGIVAYSTLGWSSDPLLSTMLAQGNTYLASVVFHELAHQRVYVRGDTEFNESFAVAVETTGVRKWLRASGNEAGLREYEADRVRRAEFAALVFRTRDELGKIYRGADSVEKKRAAKAAAIETLRARYRKMRDGHWGGYAGYDGWFAAPINNAKLAAVSVYSDQVAAFMRLFDLCSDDYEQFYAAVQQLGKLDKSKRADALKSAASCYAAQS